MSIYCYSETVQTLVRSPQALFCLHLTPLLGQISQAGLCELPKLFDLYKAPSYPCYPHFLFPNFLPIFFI
jgi:hypothetical protein